MAQFPARARSSRLPGRRHRLRRGLPVLRYPCIPRCGSHSLAGRAVPTLPSGWCRRPRPLQGLGSAQRGRKPTRLGPRTRAGAGRGGEGRGRARAGRAGGRGPPYWTWTRRQASACVLRGRGASRSPGRGRERTGKAGEGWEGKEGSGCEPGCGILRSPQPRHQSLLRRLGRLPARRGKMPLTQGCEEGAEVAAGAPRAAAAAAVRVL